MKKLTLVFSMMIALVGLNANAAMYIVGMAPFGGWNPGGGVEMTDNGNGIYTYVTDQISGTVWFVFGDGLDNDWNVFNANYRYCPTNGGQVIEAGVEYQTQKYNNGDNAYSFNGIAGQSYQITFNTNNNKFKIDGYTEPPVFTTFTVAGTPASVFGTAWEPWNTANDMTLVNGLYTWTKQNVEITSGTTVAFKVAANNDWDFSWPAENYWRTFDESGVYNLTITFNEDTKEVNMEATKVGDTEVNPLTGHLYVLGQVNGNNWNPSTGTEMTTTDGNVFTLTGAVINNADGEEYGWFSFTSKLGVNADDWSFGPYRRGAYADQADIQAGVVAPLNDWGTDIAFRTLPGVYDIVVNLSENTVLLTSSEVEVGDVYIIGDVNNIGWSATEGVQMNYNEGIYTANITTQNQGDLGIAYIGFTKKLADAESETPWEDIAPYRFGPVSEGDFWMTEELLGVNCALATDGSYISIAIPAGTWTVTVDLVNNTFKIDGTWPDEPVVPETTDVYIIGDVNNIGWSATEGVQMTYNEGIYTANITTQEQGDLGIAYIGFTKKLADAESETPWEDIAPYRFGPVSNGDFWMTEELLGVNCDLATDGSYISIAIPAGTWTVTVDMENNTFSINGEWPIHEPYTGPLYILGEANGNGWNPADGVQMTYDAENAVFTATISAEAENWDSELEGNYSFFSFTKVLAENEEDWESIAPYRIGAVAYGSFLVTDEYLGQTLALTPGQVAFRVLSGYDYDLTVSVDKMTIVINRVEHTGLRGDVNGDTSVSIDDVTVLIDYLLSGNAEGINLQNADCNLSGGITIDDVTTLIDYLLSNSWNDME